MCYKDRSWCSYYQTCTNAPGCDRAMTEKDFELARDLNLPISWMIDKPSCYKEEDKEDES